MRNMKENKHKNGNNIKKKLCVNTTSQFYYIWVKKQSNNNPNTYVLNVISYSIFPTLLI